ncbi:MAG: DUF4190 domain-containing protein [Clostridia bacterium]|nr:DUF4190 domain-containing protein [Clostridia bacterium]
MDEMNNQNAQVPAGKNGVAVAGMVLGIVGLVFCFTGWFAIICTILGLVLSIVGMKKAKETGAGKGMAIAGIVCSVIGLVISAIILIIALMAVKAITDAVNTTDYNQLYNYLNNLNSLY